MKLKRVAVIVLAGLFVYLSLYTWNLRTGHLDTLAEILFQLGKKDEAVATQKKAITLSPKRVYFKKQLARIEAGDPNAPRPAEDGED